MKPTVSASSTSRSTGTLSRRLAGSSVSNIRSPAATSLRVSRLSSVDLPALV